jgi:1-acyl-sn-glycerol-3-phosphate acyltransferase
MHGTDRLLPPGHIVPHPTRIKIIIGKPLTFGPEVLEGPGAKARRVVTDEVMRAIQNLSGQEYVPVYASTHKEELANANGGAKPDHADPGPARSSDRR